VARVSAISNYVVEIKYSVTSMHKHTTVSWNTLGILVINSLLKTWPSGPRVNVRFQNPQHQRFRKANRAQGQISNCSNCFTEGFLSLSHYATQNKQCFVPGNIQTCSGLLGPGPNKPEKLPKWALILLWKCFSGFQSLFSFYRSWNQFLPHRTL